MIGKFIVIEGIDGSGKTTQAKLLSDELKNRGIAVTLTEEPTQGSIGQFIRETLQCLRGPFSWETMALLFAADRMEHVRTIRDFLDAGTSVVCDRYTLSSIIYQSVTAWFDPKNGPAHVRCPEDFARLWVQAVNERALAPDLTLVLDVSPTGAAARRKSRGQKEEHFEVAELQWQLSLRYARLGETSFLKQVPGDSEASDVAKVVLQYVLPLFEERP